MGLSRHRLAVLAAAAVLTGAAVAATALGLSIPPTPATPTSYPSISHPAQYATYDGKGRPTARAGWHWTSTGGNCCETYVQSTAAGRILEYGGTYPYTSDDHGKTWQQVVFTTPLVNGEGAIVAGPKGNIYGIGWDPYTGDHLQAVVYGGSDKKWQVAEAPLKTPFFDREWITYAQGPFVLGGQTVPFVTIVRGGGVDKSVELLSGDGLTYLTPSIPSQDVKASQVEPKRFRIPVVANPDADSWQPNPGAFTLPLTGGGVLLMDNSEDNLGCDAAHLNAGTAKWECVTLAWKPQGTVRQDSRGWLTQVHKLGSTALDLGLSKDGGVTWQHTTLTPPKGGTLEGGTEFLDVKVDGRRGEAVVASRVDDAAGKGQDLVWRVDTRSPQPRVVKIYAVGLGNISTVIGVLGATSDRFDFPSLTLLPDGRIVASFDDSTTPRSQVRDVVPATNPTGHSPAIAILD